ncbi:MAG: hypothetical protein INR65_07370 [Gluconacetobacter diazotrophicus]|nr:hypothetical protein [Gluconacetobacter diazotrophicus]
MSAAAAIGPRDAADAILIVLLLATLVFAARLERGLARLRGDRAALERMLEEFGEWSRQAEEALDRFGAVSDRGGREIAAQVEAASALCTELGALTVRAGTLIRDLRFAAEAAAPVAVPATLSPSRNTGPDRGGREIAPFDDIAEEMPRSRAERELLSALRGMR